MTAYDYEYADMKRKARHIYERRVNVTDPREQPTLALDGVPQPDPELTIDAKFRAFHAANPQVYAALLRLACAYAEKGARQIRVKWLWEELRNLGIETTGTGGYGLNNIFTSRYARLLAQEPGLGGLIELRQLKAE